MKIRSCRAAFIACGSIVAMAGLLCAQDVPGTEPQSIDGTHAKGQSERAGARGVIPHRMNPHEAGAPTAGSTGVITPLITFHGGPVIATPYVYLIWYGNWNQTNGSDTSAGQQIVRDFLNNLSGSGYYMANSTYSGVTGSFNVGQEYTDSYSQGSRLSDRKVQAVVTNA